VKTEKTKQPDHYQANLTADAIYGCGI